MGSISSIDDAYSWNLSRIADAFGMHRDTVRKRLRAAVVKPQGKKGGVDVYALADVGPALFIAEKSMFSDGDEPLNPDKLEPKDRKDYFQSELERLKLEEKTKELIPDSEYRSDLAKTLKEVVSFFESLPDVMEQRRSFSPEQLEELERACDSFRESLYARVNNL